jgi:hypothetical protein
MENVKQQQNQQRHFHYFLLTKNIPFLSDFADELSFHMQHLISHYARQTRSTSRYVIMHLPTMYVPPHPENGQTYLYTLQCERGTLLLAL